MGKGYCTKRNAVSTHKKKTSILQRLLCFFFMFKDKEEEEEREGMRGRKEGKEGKKKSLKIFQISLENFTEKI